MTQIGEPSEIPEVEILPREVPIPIPKPEENPVKEPEKEPVRKPEKVPA